MDEYGEMPPQPMGGGIPYLPDSGVGEILRSIPTSVARAMEDFSHVLVGEIRQIVTDARGNVKEEWIKVNEFSIVNTRGRWEIISFLTGIINEANTWSDLTEKEQKYKSMEITLQFAYDCALKSERWGLSLEDMSTLVIMVENFVELGILKKIESKKMWDVIQRTVRESRHVVDSGEGGRQKTFGLFR